MASVIILLPALIVLLQHDTGSAIVFFALIIVLYRAGLTGFIPLAAIALPVLGVLALVLPKLILTAALLIVAAIFLYFHKNEFETSWLLRWSGLPLSVLSFLLITASTTSWSLISETAFMCCSARIPI